MSRKEKKGDPEEESEKNKLPWELPFLAGALSQLELYHWLLGREEYVGMLSLYKESIWSIFLNPETLKNEVHALLAFSLFVALYEWFDKKRNLSVFFMGIVFITLLQEFSMSISTNPSEDAYNYSAILLFSSIVLRIFYKIWNRVK